ncbi:MULTISPECIES: hypothetical protein [Paenibacillus]|nr:MULTISPECIES: hypothetical protein [Paenibacillus]
MMERDFNYFIEKYGESGAREKFEDACYTMLKRKFQDHVYKIKGNPGDEGIDIYVGNITKKIDVFQCKFFMKNIDYNQIKKSFLRAANNSKFSMKSWTLLIPQDFTFPERCKWDKWQTQMETEYNIEIKLMDKSAIMNCMKQFDIYNQIFNIKPLMQLEELYNIIKYNSDHGKIGKNFNFVIEKIREYISHRIAVFKKLFYNSYDINEYFKEKQITSFLELFQQSEIHIQFLFNDIDNLIKDIRKIDNEIGFLCERFVFMQGVFINKIEEDLQYTDEYLFNLKSYTFQVSLQKIIWDLSVEEQNIKKIINESQSNDILLNEFDMRDTIVTYKNKQDILRLLALHVIKIHEHLCREDFDIFYGREDKKQLCFSLIYPDMVCSGANMPYPTSISKMIKYINLSNSKFNEEGEFTFHLESNNTIFLEELDIKTLQKLHKIKKTANIKYHHFINENRIDKIIKKFNESKIDYKIVSLVEEPKYFDKLEKLLSNLSELSSELITGKMYDGNLVISNGTNFRIRKLK